MKYFLVLALVIMSFGCSEEPELTQDQILENLKIQEFEAFIGWDISDRGSYHIFDKRVEGDQPTERWIVFNDNDEISFRRIFPFKELKDTPLNGNTEFDLSYAIHQFYEIDVDELRFISKDSNEVVLIKKNDLSFLYSFQDSLGSLSERFKNWELKKSNLYTPKQE